MSDNYLFDGGGPPDAEVARLERLLAPLRLRKTAPPAVRVRPRRSHRRWYVPAAAAVGLLAVGAWWWRPAPSPIELTMARGSAKIDGRVILDEARPEVGQWIENGSNAASGLRLVDVFDAQIGSDARVRVGQLATGQCTLELARGKVRVLVRAAPGVFQIVTPATTVIDLGCEYEVDVGADGTTQVGVTSGRVELVSGVRKAQVASDWRCRAHPTIGLGTPRRNSATPVLIAALDAYDWNGRTRDALEPALGEAGAEDGPTLWALFLNAAEGSRPVIFDRAAALFPKIQVIAREAAISGNEKALTELRKALTSG